MDAEGKGSECGRMQRIRAASVDSCRGWAASVDKVGWVVALPAAPPSFPGEGTRLPVADRGWETASVSFLCPDAPATPSFFRGEPWGAATAEQGGWERN